MGLAGRKKVETVFSSDIIMPRLERMYAELGVQPSGPARAAGAVQAASRAG
jgi:hypothetical protein